MRTSEIQANQVVEMVTARGLDCTRPISWTEQLEAAFRLLERHDINRIRRACRGMGRFFPYSAGVPWDTLDLEQHFKRALEADASD